MRLELRRPPPESGPPPHEVEGHSYTCHEEEQDHEHLVANDVHGSLRYTKSLQRLHSSARERASLNKNAGWRE